MITAANNINRGVNYHLNDLSVENNDKKIREVSQKFQALFLNKFVAAMFKQNELYGQKESQSQKIYKSMLQEKMASILSKQSDFGLKSHIAKQIIELQEINRGDQVAK